jgi:effector-binding domain-containing protein
MIDAPRIVESPAQRIAFIHLVVPREQIQQVMGPAISEVYAALAAQGLAPAGPWFTHHARPPGAEFDFDACVPVGRDVMPVGRVKAGERVAARVARAEYRGGYEGLAGAWPELRAWATKGGHVLRPDLWEVYAVGPEVGPDTSKWCTELNQPLV